MIDFNKIKNIVLDLGNVIININFDLTYKAIADLTPLDVFEVKKKLDEIDLWNRYEEGLVSDVVFLDTLYNALELTCSRMKLIEAWHGLLLDIPKKRIEMIDYLKENYNLYILSNTNDLHIQEINERIKEEFGREDLRSLVHKAYYSYEMKMRKPNKEIYMTMLADGNMRADETLFLDDNEDNIEGAKKMGIQTILVDPDNSCMTEYLKDA